jgi:type I restriction enzyme M protein
VTALPSCDEGLSALAIKKSDLYSSLWKSCDELRGGMDASQYKDYILVLLFVKYVSDKAKSDPDSLISVPDGGSFDDMVALVGDPEIGDKINKIVAALAKENDLEKIIDLADFNDPDKLGKGKEMQDRLSRLVRIFQSLDFRGSRAGGDDLLGDAYEYLMRHFATESGKSKGQFYTPSEVSRILAKVVGAGSSMSLGQSAYDPTCGSGSLLLKVADEAPHGLTLFGQEKDTPTRALSVMNMVLHDNETADIRDGDTITSPKFLYGNGLKTFDYVVANPPFSSKSWSNGLEDEYGRFEYGRPPEKNGDYAFLLHVLKSMKTTGKAAVILPHGVLFRGNAEAGIRKQLLQRGFIKGIIGLPSNLFYGTGIPACILVLEKENAQARKGVFMIDASKGFMKDGPKNRLRSQDIHKIVDVFTKQTEVARYSRLVPLDEIAHTKNEFNLNIPRYIDASEPEDIQDLHAHLHGGIPDRDLDALSGFWEAFPALRGQLFQPNRPGYSDLIVDVAVVQQAIVDSPEFQKFAGAIDGVVTEWFMAHREALAGIDADTKPGEVIAAVGDDLLSRFKPVALLDEYDVYEQLMTYWHDVMHDDVFLIMSEGWVEASKPRKTIDDKARKLSETPDLTIGSGKTALKYKMDLVPPGLLIARYFPAQQVSLDDLIAAAEEAARRVEEFLNEHALEEGLLGGAIDDDKVTKASAANRMNDAKNEGADTDELAALLTILQLYESEAATKRAAKDAQSALDVAVLSRYGELAESDVQALVLDGKWRATMQRRINAEATDLTLSLVSRVRGLGERYAEPVGELVDQLAKSEAQVMNDLEQMGVR